MAKGSGNNRTISSTSATASRTASATATRQEFSPNAKFSDFEGDSSVNGGSYSLSIQDDKYTMLIDTENGYNEDFGSDGTLIVVSLQRGTETPIRLDVGFVEGNGFRESGGRNVYTNDRNVERYINNVMPYYAERANNVIKDLERRRN